MAKVPFRILAFDGGGIRGAFGIGLVAELERQLGRPLADFFDLIAGTSTGAITGTGLAVGKSGAELVDFYRQFGRQIFTPREPHRPRGWIRWFYPSARKLLRRRTGQNFDDFFRARYCPMALAAAFAEGFGVSTLGDVERSRLIVPTVNLTQGKSHLFRTPHLPDVASEADIPLVDVLLAATAAPTYFPHQVMPDGQAYCDGGLWAVNPSILAIAEAMKVKQQCLRENCDPDYDTADIRVPSIGTGDAKYSLSPPGADAGIIYWAQHVADVMTNLQVEGSQAPLSFFLGPRYRALSFALPDKTWTLDNTENIERLFEMGRKRATEELPSLMDTFFTAPGRAYVSFDATEAADAAGS